MLEVLSLPFFQRALLVGVILGGLMAMLGVLVVLRRMSFFADAIGHSALTGIAIGILLSVNPFPVAVVFALIIAAAIVAVRHFSRLPIDTILGVFFPAAVALGVILIQLSPGYQTDLIGFLFGDILTVNNSDIIASVVLAIVVLLTLVFAGKKFLTIALDEALAHAQGIAVPWYELLLFLLLAAVIAMAIKLVGIILVTAMLIIPAATAQNIANSMTSFFSLALLVSLISTMAGMLISAALNVPSGPTIVLVSAFLFSLSFVLRVTRVNG